MASDGRSLRSRIGQSPIGVFWMAIGDPSVAEIAAGSGPDAFVIDAQHGTFTRGALEATIGVLRDHPVIVRTADGSSAEIARALDAGAEGVLVPMIETVAQAAEAAEAARFPPHGTRSAGGIRPLSGDFVRYVARCATDTIVGVMIETARGVANAAAIAATPGIDFVFIGTGDLAISLGCFPAIDERHAEACAAVKAACDRAGRPCGIFTMNADAAAARAREGYAVVVVANDIDVVSSGFRAARATFAASHASPAPIHPALTENPAMTSSPLTDLAAALAGGGVDVVDLTQTLSSTTPVIQLPPPNAPSNAFAMQQISHYDEHGPAWYWNNLTMGEHTGTHLDVPAHWVTGRDYADGFTDTVPPARFVAPACVIDCSAEVAADEGFVCEPAHVEAWEAKHGRIPAGSWVLLRSDWSKRTDPEAFLNMTESGPRTPGPSPATMRLMVERGINGWGVETVGTDHGLAFGFDPPFPAHNMMHGANKLGLASLTNLDRLPPTGAIVIAAPLKIERGSGSPVRVLALVPKA